MWHPPSVIVLQAWRVVFLSLWREESFVWKWVVCCEIHWMSLRALAVSQLIVFMQTDTYSSKNIQTHPVTHQLLEDLTSAIMQRSMHTNKTLYIHNHTFSLLSASSYERQRKWTCYTSVPHPTVWILIRANWVARAVCLSAATLKGGGATGWLLWNERTGGCSLALAKQLRTSPEKVARLSAVRWRPKEEADKMRENKGVRET